MSDYQTYRKNNKKINTLCIRIYSYLSDNQVYLYGYLYGYNGKKLQKYRRVIRDT